MTNNFIGRNIYLELLELIRLKETCVLSTVTKAVGSTPQKPGSSAVFGKKHLLAGTVGGGAVELKIKEKSINAINTKKSGYYSFDLNNGITDSSEAICGGRMNILLDANPTQHIDVYEEIKSSCHKKISGVLITCLNTTRSAKRTIKRIWVTKYNLPLIYSSLNHKIKQRVTTMLNTPVKNDFNEITLYSENEEEKILAFLESVVPSPRLLIAGAGHVGKALSHLGNLLDFEVIIWDDREEFANKENLPDAHHVLSGGLNEQFGKIKIDHDTYLVIVTHGHKNDSDVLRTFIKSPAAYIGMIGSTKKIEQMRKKFLDKDWATQKQWDNIYTPIGLDIHSTTVQEIALSIAAQLVLVRNQNNGKDE